MAADEASAAAPVPQQVGVVIVDDTADLRLLLRMALETADGQPGFSVLAEAGDGATGVEVIRRHQPDVVLLDLAMPVMDGLEALPLIREAAPNAKTVVLSGFESARMGDAASAHGADAYLQKGATPEAIVAAIRQALGAPTRAEASGVGARPESFDARTELQLLQDALATAAHELRSPASVLAGFAQTLQRRRDAMDEATLHKVLDAIVRQSMVLDRVTSDLLAATQTQRGTLVVNPAPMKLCPALEAAALAAPASADIHVECPREVWVFADRVRVDQMLGNLVSNAVKYGAPPMRLCGAATTERAEVEVEDTGPGVPESFRPQLFAPYTRANGQRASGTGLGLFVVKTLAEAQGGHAWYSPSAGGGARFCFSLPLSAAEASIGG